MMNFVYIKIKSLFWEINNDQPLSQPQQNMTNGRVFALTKKKQEESNEVITGILSINVLLAYCLI